MCCDELPYLSVVGFDDDGIFSCEQARASKILFSRSAATSCEHLGFDDLLLRAYFPSHYLLESRSVEKKEKKKISSYILTPLDQPCYATAATGFIWLRQRHHQQIFLDINDQHNDEIFFGNLKRFQFRELQAATDNFSSKNILGKGGFGNVCKGQLLDGCLVVVKRLKDGNAAGG